MDVAEPDNPGRFINRDITQGEIVEAGLDDLIERRHNARVAEEGDQRAVEAAWRESERREEAKRREGWHEARLRFCEHLQGVYTKLADEHGLEAEKLREGQPKGA